MARVAFADLSLTYALDYPRDFDYGHRTELGGQAMGGSYTFVRAWRFTLALEIIRDDPAT